MCGIFGQLGGAPRTDEMIVERLAHLLHHRGPDDHGFEHGRGWALGFRRLSILDLSPAGHQPMSTPDRRCWIAFNGEIYNYLELRAELEARGERFVSGGDTEVLLRLLAREGAEGLRRVNGMFALAFVDTERRTFLLARDRLGVKPLYYSLQQGELRFASELKALLGWPGAPRRLSLEAVASYLTLTYLPSDLCIFEGYSKLAPGHVLSGSLDAPALVSIAPYWRLELNDQVGDGALAPRQLDELSELLEDAVRIRLRSDVPVGMFLSGGVDSGLVAVLAGRSEGVSPLALTVGFGERDYDETALARATAEHAGLELRVIPHRPAALADLDRVAWYFDEPFGDASALPTFALCEAAAEHAVVFLSGDGGDEAFGGYRRYIEVLRHRRLAALSGVVAGPAALAARLAPALSMQRYRLLKLSLPDSGMAAAFDALPQDPAVAAAAHPDLRPLLPRASWPLWGRWAQTRGRGLTARQQQLDYTLYLPDDVLVKVDRCSMAHSLEVRSPLLDYRLVEWAARLPRAALLNAREGKLPLRALGARLLPPEVQRGSKRGFAVPLGPWFRQPAGVALLRERLLSPEAGRRGLWDQEGVAGLIAAHQSGRGRDLGPVLWRLLMLDAWARHYLDGAAPAAAPPRRVEALV